MDVRHGELRFRIPKVLLRAFTEEPRIVLKYRPEGIWPVDPGVLLETGILDELARNEEFLKNFEIVVMPKI
jgi:hypothetical protein